jgi:flagellar hook-associated protein 1 FlgK
VRALLANQSALQTIGANISNANTEGYSRQSVQLTTAGGQFSGAGYLPKGVQVETVTRAHDAFVTREAQLSASLAAADQTRADLLGQLESALPMGERGLGHAATQFLNAFVDVASHPQDLAARQTVLARADDLAATMRSAAERIETLQRGVREDVSTTVQTINALAQGVARLNQQIASQRGSGHAPNDLLDQRDHLVQQINEYIQVNTIAADDGTLGLFIGGGQRLVLGGEALTLGTAPDTYDPARVAVTITESGTTRTLSEGNLVGGSVSALMGFQAGALVDARNRVGQMAAVLASAVNQQQAFGLTQHAEPRTGPALYQFAGPRVLPADTNALDPNGGFLANPSLSVTDASQLLASDYELRGDPANAGSYLLTRLADGLERSVADGDTVDGFTLHLGSPAPAAGDRYRLQPVAMAAASLASVLRDPLGVAAAAPLTATSAVDNTGTATVSRFDIADASVDPALTASITFSDNNGSYDWELLDAGGTTVDAGSGSWAPGQPISLNGFALDLAGVPAAGDRLQVAPTPFPAASNGNALALMALRDENLVGRTLTASGTVTGGRSLSEAYAQTLSEIGVRVQSAHAAAEMSAAVAKDARQAQQATAGVNLDEEAARLIQFQQAYQAAAKVLQVAQSTFDIMLNAAAG